MKERRAENPIRAGEITVIPIMELSLNHFSSKDGISLYVSYVPVGIVINSPGGKQAIDIHGREIALDSYMREIPGLQGILSGNDSP